MTAILDDFLSAEKLEQGKVDAKTNLFNLKVVVEELIEQLQVTAKQGQSIRYEHKGDELVGLDKQIFRNILLNLLSNAIKYSNEDIELTSTNEKGSLSISVADKGIGIPEEDQGKLFGNFFRAKNAQDIHGTGLGLNIVKRYVELLGGTISFISRQNLGSTFFVHLPAIQ